MLLCFEGGGGKVLAFNICSLYNDDKSAVQLMFSLNYNEKYDTLIHFSVNFSHI